MPTWTTESQHGIANDLEDFDDVWTAFDVNEDPARMFSVHLRSCGILEPPAVNEDAWLDELMQVVLI
jgi:hypothetical protein